MVSLRSQKEIQKLFAKGTFKKFSFFNIKYRCLPRENALPLEILWAIPKKFGKACKRNAMKRKSKEAFFQVLRTCSERTLQTISKETDIAQKFQIAFIPQKKFLYLPPQARMDEIREMLTSIHFLKRRQ